MAIIKTVEGKTPQWGKNCFIAENAVLTGDCILGDDCSIWYSAVLRSDVDAIRCGNRVNVQDCACIHQTGTMPCILEDDVSVGHGAIVHGATVRKGALIGMNATVLDKADIGEGMTPIHILPTILSKRLTILPSMAKPRHTRRKSSPSLPLCVFSSNSSISRL